MFIFCLCYEHTHVGMMCLCTHMQRPEEVPATRLSPVLADIAPEMTFDSGGYLRFNTRKHTWVSSCFLLWVYCLYLTLAPVQKVSLDTGCFSDTLALSPVATLFLFSVIYQYSVCLSLLSRPFLSVSIAHVITQEFIQLTCCCKHNLHSI